QKLHQLGIEVLPHLHYFPDFSPIDFHFFCSLDNFLTQKLRKQEDFESAFLQFLFLRDSDFYVR
ncbi:Histone-lysine N-methyltransferase SETMAR, partial [Habropoda laboriosa]